jgi:hypothetical protein
LSDRVLRKAIADLTAIERKSFQKRQRFAFIAYLDAVLEFYALLRRNNCAKRSAGRIAKVFRIRTQKKRTHPFRVILDATSAADEKTRSRLCRALRYCWRERTRWTDFQQFLRENHGPAGAAAKWSALQRRKRECQVELDTRDLVPEIPLIVDVPLVEPGQLFVRGGRVFRQPDAAEADLQENRGAEPLRNS